MLTHIFAENNYFFFHAIALSWLLNFCFTKTQKVVIFSIKHNQLASNVCLFCHSLWVHLWKDAWVIMNTLDKSNEWIQWMDVHANITSWIHCNFQTYSTVKPRVGVGWETKLKNQLYMHIFEVKLSFKNQFINIEKSGSCLTFYVLRGYWDLESGKIASIFVNTHLSTRSQILYSDVFRTCVCWLVTCQYPNGSSEIICTPRFLYSNILYCTAWVQCRSICTVTVE